MGHQGLLQGLLLGGAITELRESTHPRPFCPIPLLEAGDESIRSTLGGCPESHGPGRALTVWLGDALSP